MLAVGLLVLGWALNPRRPGPVKQMPYESGMDPIHDTRRRFTVCFHLLAIAFLVFDVELVFLYPWAVAVRAEQPDAASRACNEAAGPGGTELPAEAAPRPVWRPVFVGGMLFVGLLLLGFVYDWRKGVFQWR